VFAANVHLNSSTDFGDANIDSDYCNFWMRLHTTANLLAPLNCSPSSLNCSPQVRHSQA